MRLFRNKIAKKVCQNGLLLVTALISIGGFSQMLERKAYAMETASEEVIYHQGSLFTPEENVQIQVDEETFVKATKGIVKLPTLYPGKLSIPNALSSLLLPILST